MVSVRLLSGSLRGLQSVDAVFAFKAAMTQPIRVPQEELVLASRGKPGYRRIGGTEG